MAIQPTNKPAAPAAQPAPAAQQQQPMPGANLTPPIAGVMGLRSAFGGAVASTAAGEAVRKYFESFKKTIDEGQLQYKLHILDAQLAPAVLSCIMLSSVGQAANGRTVVAVATMIVAASGPRPNPQQIAIQGQTVEILATPGDIANDPLWEKVKAEVSKTYGQVDIYDAGMSVIHSELDAADSTRMLRVLSDAAEACFRALDEILGGVVPKFNLGMINRSDRVTARVTYNQEGVESSCGLPVRTGVTIETNGSTSTNNSDPWSVSQVEMTAVDGYMDLIYVRPQPPVYGAAPMTQHFFGRYNITQMKSRLGAVTLEIALLALHSATLLSKNMAWAAAFRPRNTRPGEVNLRDIGAVGFDIPQLVGETQQGRKIDTTSVMFDLNMLHDLLTKAVHPNILYSMDVEERGSSSWLDLVFISAAQRDPVAYQRIIDAANTLTEGRFAHCFKGGDIAYDDRNRIHLGYYIDGRTNQRRDIRDVDYLAMLNHVGETDMTLVAEFDRTYSDLDRPLELRLKRRFDILQQILGDSMKVTGYARRVTFTPNFLDALGTAIQQGGFNIQPANLQYDYGGNQRRGFDTVASLAMNPAQMGGMFNLNQPNLNSNMGQVQYRWGQR